MNENDLFNFQLEYTFTADWLAELDRPHCVLRHLGVDFHFQVQ